MRSAGGGGHVFAADSFFFFLEKIGGECGTLWLRMDRLCAEGSMPYDVCEAGCPRSPFDSLLFKPGCANHAAFRRIDQIAQANQEFLPKKGTFFF